MRKALTTVLVAAAVLGCLFAEGSREASLQMPIPEPVRLFEVDPAHPYDALHHGLFDNQKAHSDSVPRGGDGLAVSVSTDTVYSLFIPEGSKPKIPTVIILTPDGTTAAAFARSEAGRGWIAASARTLRFAVAFVEPQNGKWNLALEDPTPDNGLRDERAMIADVFSSLRNKSRSDNAFISIDKNGATLAGYGEGASMAAILAASWPAMFANTLCVEPRSFDEAKARALLDEGAYTINSEFKHGYGLLKAGEIPMPVLVVPGEDRASADAVVRVWNEVAERALPLVQDRSAATELYGASMAAAGSGVESLWPFCVRNGRYLGYSGGTLRIRPDWEDPRFETHNEKVGEDPLVRRWRVYTPSSYDPEARNPLVVVLHGSSSAITDIAEESRWTDRAEEEGFVVLFVQGYPYPGWTPSFMAIPGWQLRDTSAENPDILYILSCVDSVIGSRSIDSERVYVTGHSLGSMMISTIMNSPLASRFAAFAPVGAFSGPGKTATETEIAVWGISGEWEFRNGDKTAAAWAARLGLQAAPPEGEEGFTEGKYKTWPFVDADGHAPVKATQVMDSPHVYMAEEGMMIWDWFKGIRRDAETGKLVFL